MEILYTPKQINQPTTISIGTFDGVHRGHRFIIDYANELAKRYQFANMIITFDPHPRFVLAKEIQAHFLLTTLEEKLEIMSQMPVDIVYIQKFTKEFSQLTPEEFIKILKENFNMRALVMGYDHSFGVNRSGSYEDIKSLSYKYNFFLYKFQPFVDDGVFISSTKIRNLLIKGLVSQANKLLGYNYFIKGKVIEGSKIGRQLGFPTANIGEVAEEKIIPGSGVYIIKAFVEDEQYKGIMNIGFRPTFQYSHNNISLEAHLFDFYRDIYNKPIKIEFLLKIRDEIKFNTIEDLIQQIYKDRELALRFFYINF
ncbi:MAG TPA: bifunctional riboflavin kinase/FAD synthetase [Bacteroidales bacterium]|nr:bifunctional riboflavin kinase/FAD synthetase [Bacteroidales bacterium]